MLPLNRRDFLRAGSLGLAGTMMNGLWSDLLAKGIAPPPTVTFFEERFGVTREQMKTILEPALSKGGEFSELYFEYKISNSVRMEEDIIKDSSESITLGVGIRVLKGAQTGYGYTDDLSFERDEADRTDRGRYRLGKRRIKVADLTQKMSPLRCTILKHLCRVRSPRKRTWLKKPMLLHNRMINESRRSRDLTDELQYMTIANSEGLLVSDARPQVRMIVSPPPRRRRPEHRVRDRRRPRG